MEACILTFSASNGADDALKKVVSAEAHRDEWLHEVGVIQRPYFGRFSIRATFADDQETDVREGDIAGRISDAGGMTGYLIGSLVGPMHADMVRLEGELGAHHAGRAVEKQLLHTDEIKDLLPRGSSALVLVSRPDVNDRFVQMFSSWSPEVVRRDIAPETQQRLEAFARKTQEGITQPQADAH